MRWLLVLLILLATSPVFAGVALMGEEGLTPDAAPGGDCQAGTYIAAYNGDHSSGADYICYQGLTASEEAGATQGTPNTLDANYVEFDAKDEGIKFSETGVFPVSAGSLYFDFYIADGNANTDIDANQLLENRFDASNKMWVVTLDSGNKLRVLWESANNQILVDCDAYNFQLNTWYRAGLTWQVSTNTVEVAARAAGETITWDESDLCYNTGTSTGTMSAPGEITIGESESNQSINDDVRIRDLAIVNTYQGTDPF